MGGANEKKIKAVQDAFPQLDPEEARRLLEEANGSVNKACELALESGEWIKSRHKKKPSKSKDESANTQTSPVEGRHLPRGHGSRERKPRYAEPPKQEKIADPPPKATASVIVVGTQKSKVESGISFADMIKRQKQEPVQEEQDEVHEQEQQYQEIHEKAVENENENENENEKCPEEEEAEVLPPPPSQPEPRKERPPLPLKYDPEFNRVAIVDLPSTILALASNAFTFDSEPGRAPTPPRPQPQAIPHPQVIPQAHPQSDWRRAPMDNYNRQFDWRSPQQQQQQQWNNQGRMQSQGSQPPYRGAPHREQVIPDIVAYNAMRNPQQPQQTQQQFW